MLTNNYSTQKVSKFSSQSCDITNQLRKCRRHDHYREVRGHAPEKFCKITPKNTHFRTGQIESFSKTKKAFAYALKSRASPKYSQKTSFAFTKTAWFRFTVFHFKDMRGSMAQWPPLGTLVMVHIDQRP